MTFIDRAMLHIRRAVKPHRLFVHTVTIYVGFLIVLFIILAGARYALVRLMSNPLDGFMVSVIDNLSAGIITAAATAILLFIVSPRISIGPRSS